MTTKKAGWTSLSDAMDAARQKAIATGRDVGVFVDRGRDEDRGYFTSILGELLPVNHESVKRVSYATPRGRFVPSHGNA